MKMAQNHMDMKPRECNKMTWARVKINLHNETGITDTFLVILVDGNIDSFTDMLSHLPKNYWMETEVIDQ